MDFKVYQVINFLLWWMKRTKCDFSIFMESLLAHNHLPTDFNCSFIIISRFSRLLSEQNKFESSLNRTE